MNIHIYIQNGDTVYEPVVIGGVAWELQRKGQPGKLAFTVLADSQLKIEEGNAIRLDVNGTPIFFGFLFERSWGSDGQVKITAYDQLRYLKNKDTYNYTELSAGELIQKIAGDFNLQVGTLEDTGYKIPFRTAKDKTLFDIILDAVDLTMIATKKIYVLYDDVGKLTLKNVENMKLSLMISDETAQDYDYKTSIDSSTYNQIKLYYDNDETKKREVYFTKNTETINKWGVLQYNESIDKGVDGQTIAETFLSMYNKATKSLSIKGAFGDIHVRAGCLIPVFLDVKDMQLKNYMMVESVTHTFDGGIHTMDLKLRGAGINA